MPYTDDDALPEVSDEAMRAALGQTHPYTVIILMAGPRFSPPGPDRDPEVASIIWQHGNRNFRLRAAGLLQVVCPIADGTDVVGIGVFAASPEDVDRIYSQDPAVKAGVLRYEVHPSRTFPGSMLTAWTQMDMVD
jgi:hypothetical protein